MPTHTPATALAAVLNELSMLNLDGNRTAESWRTEVQKLIDQARTASDLFLERERIARDAVGSPETTDAFERQLMTEGQATAYVFEHGQFKEITVSRDDGGSLTDEEVAIMLREGWEEVDGR
ncbi:hypothetical protein HC891_16260 [Candidatus Gracilibacteria bacterium]|nr:hypothetical protein [Candidatus Gracilibacteria bacterium]